jgi:very-short-patch-repair endonuclease
VRLRGGGQLEGLKFRRQLPVGQFIADFCCPQRRLIIELDGGQYAEQRSADEWRSRILRERGYRALRFWNDGVLTNMDGVLEQILGVLREGDSKRRNLQCGVNTRRSAAEPSKGVCDVRAQRAERAIRCRSAIAWILPSPARAKRACPLPGWTGRGIWKDRERELEDRPRLFFRGIRSPATTSSIYCRDI